MGGKFQPNPIVVDYQRERHEADARRRDADAPADEASGLFTLSVWVLSAGLFLTAFYVASEAPLHDETKAHSAPAIAGRAALTMTHRPTHQDRAGSIADALAGTQSETRR